jgi:hypothetical protein
LARQAITVSEAEERQACQSPPPEYTSSWGVAEDVIQSRVDYRPGTLALINGTVQA